MKSTTLCYWSRTGPALVTGTTQGGGGDVKTEVGRRVARVVLEFVSPAFRGPDPEPDPPAIAGTGGHPARRAEGPRARRKRLTGPLPQELRPPA